MSSRYLHLPVPGSPGGKEVTEVKRIYKAPAVIVYGRITDLTQGWGGNKIDMILGLVPINDDCAHPVLGGLVVCAS